MNRTFEAFRIKACGDGSMNTAPIVSKKSGPENEKQTWDPICDESPAPLVPDHEYLAFCKSAKKYRNPRFKRHEITLEFVLVDCESEGITLKRYFSAETAGKKRSNYKREWVIANRGIAPSRGDRMPYKKFTGKAFRIRVTTVRIDAYQEKLPPALQYSKVAAILELVQTNEKID
jgi:hypothetical protein